MFIKRFSSNNYSLQRASVRELPASPAAWASAVNEDCSLAGTLSVGRLLRPTGGRVFKVLLPPIGCRVEEAVGIRKRFGPARVRRVGVENVVGEVE